MSQHPSNDPVLLVFEIAVALFPLAVFLGGIALAVLEVKHPSLTLEGTIVTCAAAQIIGSIGLWGFIDSFRR